MENFNASQEAEKIQSLYKNFSQVSEVDKLDQALNSMVKELHELTPGQLKQVAKAGSELAEKAEAEAAISGEKCKEAKATGKSDAEVCALASQRSLEAKLIPEIVLDMDGEKVKRVGFKSMHEIPYFSMQDNSLWIDIKH